MYFGELLQLWLQCKPSFEFKPKEDFVGLAVRRCGVGRFTHFIWTSAGLAPVTVTVVGIWAATGEAALLCQILLASADGFPVPGRFVWHKTCSVVQTRPG